jgi:hypothetical protein
VYWIMTGLQDFVAWFDTRSRRAAADDDSRLSPRASLAVIGVTSLMLWAAIILFVEFAAR